jgi:hypothetical protein
MMPVMRDRALQAMVKNALEPEWEARFEEQAMGFAQVEAPTMRQARSSYTPTEHKPDGGYWMPTSKDASISHLDTPLPDAHS